MNYEEMKIVMKRRVATISAHELSKIFAKVTNDYLAECSKEDKTRMLFFLSGFSAHVMFEIYGPGEEGSGENEEI